jgi:hypothetical protein
MVNKFIKNLGMRAAEAAVIICCIGFMAPLSSCSDSSSNGEEVVSSSLSIAGVKLNSTYDVVYGGTLTISGKGFKTGDYLKLSAADGNVYIAPYSSSSDTELAVSVPDELPLTGKYTVRVIRGTEDQYLGNTTINVGYNHDAPDKDGMNLKGVVYCGKNALKGVVVSDGVNVTTTDNKGRYYLASDKSTGFVFISIPKGYMPKESSGNTPKFYKSVSSDVNTVERNDFEMVEEDTSDYVLLAMADLHLASRNNDISQFNYTFLTDVNPLIASYEAAGKKVFGVTLGDISWDTYWYDNKYGIKDAIQEVYKINCPVFNCMGNHDNDPYVAQDDWAASAPYRATAGPNYYSFNLGNIHYVVLDNIYYINKLASQGTIGDQSYRPQITESQIAWLKKDLATVTDKTAPLVLCMHIHFHYWPYLNDNNEEVYQRHTYNYNTGVLSTDPDGNACTSLLSVVSGFSDVRLLTGHNHISYTAKTDNITEYNTAAVCATWWWTGKSGYADNHICTDGTPGGYGIWEVNGSTMKGYYKSIGYDRSYQFRTYDRNQIQITAANYCPAYPTANLEYFSGEYANASSANEVLINVWNYGPGWSIKVTENGKTLKTTQISTKDPLHMISYTAQRMNHGVTDVSKITLPSTQMIHMFKVTASSATSTLNITVTDANGNTYTETMTRPKEFSTSMK